MECLVDRGLFVTIKRRRCLARYNDVFEKGIRINVEISARLSEQ